MGKNCCCWSRKGSKLVTGNRTVIFQAGGHLLGPFVALTGRKIREQNSFRYWREQTASPNEMNVFGTTPF